MNGIEVAQSLVVDIRIHPTGYIERVEEQLGCTLGWMP